MRRVLLLVCVPLLAGWLAGAAMAWWVEPRPRAVVEHAGTHCFISFCCENELAFFRDSANQHQPFYAYYDTRTGGLIAECHPREGSWMWQLVPNGRLLTWPHAHNSGEIEVQMFDPQTKELKPILTLQGSGCVLSGDGTSAALSLEEPTQIAIWDLDRRELRHKLHVVTHHKPLLKLSFNGRWLVVSDNFKDDMTDRDERFGLALFDAKSGEWCERRDHAPSTYGFAYFLPGTNLVSFSEMPFVVSRRPTPRGEAWGIEQKPGARTYFRNLDTGSLTSAREAVRTEASSTLWLVASDSPGMFHVESATGEVLSRPLPLTERERMFLAIAPNSTLLLLHDERVATYPKVLRDSAALVGITWFNSHGIKEAALLDWQTGNRRILRSSPSTPSASPASFIYPAVSMSPNGQTLALTAEAAGGFQTEFWNFPLPTRPYWLIALAAALATVLTWLLMNRWCKSSTTLEGR